MIRHVSQFLKSRLTARMPAVGGVTLGHCLLMVSGCLLLPTQFSASMHLLFAFSSTLTPGCFFIPNCIPTLCPSCSPSLSPCAEVRGKHQPEGAGHQLRGHSQGHQDLRRASPRTLRLFTVSPSVALVETVNLSEAP